MKKLLLIMLALGVIVGANAQGKYAVKDLKKMTAMNLSKRIDYKEGPMLPLNPRVRAHSKDVSSIPIGTSFNVYTVMDPIAHYLDANPETNTIMFTHRTGGLWGPDVNSGNTLYTKFTSDWGATWDSVWFLPVTNRFRYPNGVVYNPPGNTDPTAVSAVITGPKTDGAEWVATYFGSAKFDGSQYSLVDDPTAADSSLFADINLCSGNGHFHTAGKTTTLADQSNVLYYTMFNGVYNTGTNIVDWSKNYIYNLWKKRFFSGGAVYWSFNSNLAFAADGMHGYFFTFGNDSLDSPYLTGIPIVWETFDAGVTWIKQPVYHHFDQLPAIKDRIWPTSNTINLPSDQWVFRPNFPCGAVGEEQAYPGVVDAYGYLHIAAVVEGLYSYHADSLAYSYSNHPILLFDVYKNDTGWNAVFIDTIRSGIVEDVNSGFGTGANAVGWEHWINMAKSPDGTKIFVVWTDTDSTIDATNIMPEIRARSWDINANLATPVVQFTSGIGNFFFLHTSDACLYDGTNYKVPASYLDIYESNQDPDGSQKHYLINGINFTEGDYTNPVCIGCSKTTAMINSDFVSQNYPNPAKGNTTITVNIKDASKINVTVTNILGQKVYETGRNAAAGACNFTFNTNGWSKGVYFYTVTAGNNKLTKKMMVE
ncbi:MAG: T9SS type A sorting domain-containing protein [Bacteroidia bacterium]|nr:T9SS type A sorting domain-containing protein [Bacteroidia bacterium]